MTKDLTRGTPWKLIVQFALPIMAGNLLQQLYNTADTIIVGNFNGQQALSAVGACASLTVLFTDEQSIAEPQEKVNAGFRGSAERNRRWDCNYLSPEKNAS